MNAALSICLSIICSIHMSICRAFIVTRRRSRTLKIYLILILILIHYQEWAVVVVPLRLHGIVEYLIPRDPCYSTALESVLDLL
jgi:hypothetical protein